MAAGAVTVAALRHRPRQALLVVALGAVVTASAVLGPLYARAVEHSVVRNVVAHAPATARSLVVTDASDKPAAPDRLARVVGDELPPQFGAPVGGADVSVVVRTAGGTGSDGAGRVRLTSRDDVCRHVDVVDGRCARAAGEVLVSARAAQQLGVRSGDTLTATDGDPAEGGRLATVTVTGLYGGVDASSAYWAGRVRPPVVARPAQAEETIRSLDDVLTPWATLADGAWPDLRTHLDVPLEADRLDLEDLPAVRATTARVDAQARTVGGSATSSIGGLLDSTAGQRHQARTVIPLLAVQLAVLGVVVLAFVCAAATEQRRPEIALARLRGHGVLGAAGLLVRELGLLVLAGGVLGTAVGWAVAEAAARLWLEPGVRPQWTNGAALAAAASVVAGLLAILAAGTPTLRQPLTALLRRVPPRATTLQVGLVEGAVGAAAVAGLVTLLSGTDNGVALLAPGLLAIAGGLLLAQATIPTAGPLARSSLRRGRVPAALAGLQIARRPALRRLVAIITVACALLVFAVDAWTVSARNRLTRAEMQAGAPVVLTVDADSPSALRAAMLDIDPKGGFATPVVTARSATPVGPVTTAVEPAAFRRIAQWGDMTPPTDKQLAALKPPVVAPVPLPAGRDLEITARWTEIELERPAGVQGFLRPLTFEVGLTPRGEETQYVDLGRLRRGRHTYTAPFECQDCVLSSFVINRAFGDSFPVKISLALDDVRFAGQRIDLGPSTEAAWQVASELAFFSVVKVRPGPPLTIENPESYETVEVRRGDIPTPTPALISGQLSTAFRGGPEQRAAPRVAPDLAGSEHFFAPSGRLRQVPRSGPRGVLTDLRSIAGASGAGGLTTSYDVWLAADDPAREQQLVRQLSDHGLHVLARDTTGAHVASLAAEGPALALRLAVLGGIVAVVLAAAVLVVGVATSGASRARDLAGLRVVGVSAAVVRRASVREHLVVAALGVVAGTTLGLVAAQAALPQIPMFATRDRLLPLVLTPAWSTVLVTAAGCLVVLSTVSVLVGRSLARAAVPARLREGR